MEHYHFYVRLCCNEISKYCNKWIAELLLSCYVYFRADNYFNWHQINQIKKPAIAGFVLSYKRFI